ncbi:RidA family protein [Rhizobium ruizarguesonis]|jgi:enamine deaminase RidA (YjgF/YER057c/UK114 family)|uniref:RidA family protein n=1 Tax=Rhizobium ruizarguesonis TaxID=2081791 RepID=UPI001031C949|nr:RidA family protein [Rhizobium ruizarguesonis]NKJ75025.1 RidA family protein [Rhizobium leguminosarum bv. viciae]MBC2801873.1 RidA family protein [Rhizobium ruizarguesonis]NKQ74270.1 enamine deaminase RidA [Rhizobium ruizarguesonis]NKQ79373.1 enamine deaminase RidA [Rhizobium ruizarguesonis]QND21747.1 RidA family protein [Rhizobium leguminosarum bv. viciae]
MEMIAHNPANGIYAASPDYIHALEIRQPSRLLFVSGTMGLDQQGMAAADLEGQLELIWSNLRAILTSADMTVDNIVRLTSYLRDGAFVEANQNARLRSLGDRAVPTTAIIVETLRDDWLVEIEIVAAG